MSAAEQALASGDAVPLSLRGPAPKRVVAGYGFWLFLLSDIVIFAALFAAYAVLSGETAGPNQQCSCARLWHFRCGSPGIRIDDHHGGEVSTAWMGDPWAVLGLSQR